MLHRLALMALVATSTAFAHADETAIRAALQRIFPQSPSMEITNTPVAGVFEAAVDGRIFYVTEDGKYIFIGPLIDAEAKINLTDARLEQLNAIAFDSLNLDWAIKWVNGTGAQDRGFRGPGLPLLQGPRANAQKHREPDRLCLSLPCRPNSPPGGRQIRGRLVRAGPGQGLGGGHAHG